MQERRKRDASPDDIFTGLLRLHKALLDDEGVAYERVHGRISSNGAFLRLTFNDAWFAWLGPHSQSIVKLDELSERMMRDQVRPSQHCWSPCSRFWCRWKTARIRSPGS